MKLGEEATQEVTILAAFALRVNINVLALGQNDQGLNQDIYNNAVDKDGLMTLRHYDLLDLHKEKICVFFRPGHYEIAYPAERACEFGKRVDSYLKVVQETEDGQLTTLPTDPDQFSGDENNGEEETNIRIVGAKFGKGPSERQPANAERIFG